MRIRWNTTPLTAIVRADRARTAAAAMGSPPGGNRGRQERRHVIAPRPTRPHGRPRSHALHACDRGHCRRCCSPTSVLAITRLGRPASDDQRRPGLLSGTRSSQAGHAAHSGRRGWRRSAFHKRAGTPPVSNRHPGHRPPQRSMASRPGRARSCRSRREGTATMSDDRALARYRRHAAQGASVGERPLRDGGRGRPWPVAIDAVGRGRCDDSEPVAPSQWANASVLPRVVSVGRSVRVS
jgi:hypothetical protein